MRLPSYEGAYHLEEREALRCRRKQWPAYAQGKLQAGVKIPVIRRPGDEPREPGFVVELVAAGVAGAQHAEVARDARGKDRRADARRFSDDVGAALHDRPHDHPMAPPDPPHRPSSRPPP